MAELDGLFVDFYGTLAAGDHAAVTAACRRVVDELRLPISAEQLGVDWGNGYFRLAETCNDGHFRTLHQIEGDSLVECVRPYVGRIDPEPYVADLRSWLRAPPLFHETTGVLARLQRLGIRVCLVSNADHEDLAAALVHTGIAADAVVTSELAKSYKPDGGIFRLALERTGWSPDRVIHVGDSLHSDVGGARAAGLRTIWVRRRIRIGDIGTAQPDHVVEDLWGVLDVVRKYPNLAGTAVSSRGEEGVP